MEYVWIALAVLAGLFLIALVGIAWILSGIVVHPKNHTRAECLAYDQEHGVDLSAYGREIKTEPFSFASKAAGVEIKGIYIERPEGASFPDGRRRVVVLVHGYTSTLCGMMKYVEDYRRLGFDAVLYDQPNHGESGKVPTTMGDREKKVVGEVIDLARERYGGDAVIGTHGESMGAATVMLHAAGDDRLSFAVEDCGYSNLSDQLAFNMKHVYHLPRFPLLAMASLLSRLRGGILFSRVKPVEAVKKIPESLPMLFIHGTADDFVPSAMVFENFEAKRGKKELACYPGASHALSKNTHREAYGENLEKFLRKYGIV
ncbi:MAG: alpha/beta fold hydrolase [Clostridia bacterium]|nr:alpha/beta fold hydrolase [Clostridia bacterium]